MLSQIAQYLNGTCEVFRQQGNQITVRLPEGLSIAEQGDRLLGLEKKLRAKVSPDLQVFLEPMQDRNAIRQFRGVRVQ